MICPAENRFGFGRSSRTAILSFDPWEVEALTASGTRTRSKLGAAEACVSAAAAAAVPLLYRPHDLCLLIALYRIGLTPSRLYSIGLHLDVSLIGSAFILISLYYIDLHVCIYIRYWAKGFLYNAARNVGWRQAPLSRQGTPALELL